MQTGKLINVDPNGRPYTTQNGNFEGHSVTVEINGAHTYGEASCKAGNFGRMQELVGKAVVFEMMPGRMKNDGTQWPPTFKGLKDASAPQGGEWGGKRQNDPQMSERIFSSGLVQAWIGATMGPGMAVEESWAQIDDAMDFARKIFAKNFGQPQPGTQPHPAPANVGNQQYAPTQPPYHASAPSGGHDERNPPPDLDDSIPF